MIEGKRIESFWKSKSKIKLEDFEGLGDLMQFDIYIKFLDGPLYQIDSEKLLIIDKNIALESYIFDSAPIGLEILEVILKEEFLYIKLSNNQFMSYSDFFSSEILIEDSIK